MMKARVYDKPRDILERTWLGESVEDLTKAYNLTEDGVRQRVEEMAGEIGRVVFLTIVDRARAGEVDAAVFLESRGFIELPRM